MLSGASAPEQIAAVFLSLFLRGHLPYLVERYLLTRFWGAIFRSYRLQPRSVIMAERGSIITRCDTHGVSRAHFDSALASLILYYNSSFWCVIFATAALFRHPHPQQMLVACVIGGISLIALLITAPLYKRNMIGVLEVLKEELQRKLAEAPNHMLHGVRNPQNLRKSALS